MNAGVVPLEAVLSTAGSTNRAQLEAMSQAMEERRDEREQIAQPREMKPWCFGSGRPDRDPRANGAKGGSAPRRSKTAQTAKQKILASRNGQANYQLYRLELEREQARERTVRRLDREIAEMDLALLDVTEQVTAAYDELRALEVKLEERSAQVEAASTDEQQLEALLRAADESGLLERVLTRLDFEQREVEA